MRVYSQERWRERYRICFLWKLSQDLISGYAIHWQLNGRRGRYVVPLNIPKTAPAKIRVARERTLAIHHRARLFNLLPKTLRKENSGDFSMFKNNLDILLAIIPDQPTTPGLVRAAVTNSLVDQVPLGDTECLSSQAVYC